jgi:hypothetical protein
MLGLEREIYLSIFSWNLEHRLCIWPHPLIGRAATGRVDRNRFYTKFVACAYRTQDDFFNYQKVLRFVR